MVSHRNVLSNLEMLRVAFGSSQTSVHVGWVPLYHDMGLIVNALEPLYLGALGVLMAPVSFLQRPISWLRAISDYKAEVAGGPNFAYDLCATRLRPEQRDGIDLSSWRVAFNAAEPVRAETIERFVSTFAPCGFDPAAMHPTFGMAEATVFVSGRHRGAGVTTLVAGGKAPIVGCGRAVGAERIAIVDPESRVRLAPRAVGEVWVAGPNVARGYWGNPDATTDAFEARIAGEQAAAWLRTGDLGFLDAEGELYITGRIKDLVIIRGTNHYPQDIERTVEEAHPALRRHACAAFAASIDGEEKLVVVQELERTSRRVADVDEVVGCIREAVANAHDIAVHEVVLLGPGAVPKTTSGKIQRSLARQLWREGRLDVIGGDRPAAERP
jgi:acyl-CoA synthetase (AMP-forming)/AMP-acid ligase II